MVESRAIAGSLIGSFDRSYFRASPYRHWLPEGLLPANVCNALDSLPVKPPKIENTQGRRETHNSLRLFFEPRSRKQFPVCDALAGALQSQPVVSWLERLCGVDLRASNLRVEYCLDTDGFWLKPHTDIGAKLFTMLIYLSTDPGSEGWGTDIVDRDFQLVMTSPIDVFSG